ncbi:hypothetical protein GCM10011341_27360 [Frigidibacter albus]|nr:hypothetical protein GCM10011341_27360 [Frigidibacter albus]
MRLQDIAKRLILPAPHRHGAQQVAGIDRPHLQQDLAKRSALSHRAAGDAAQLCCHVRGGRGGAWDEAKMQVLRHGGPVAFGPASFAADWLTGR